MFSKLLDTTDKNYQARQQYTRRSDNKIRQIDRHSKQTDRPTRQGRQTRPTRTSRFEKKSAEIDFFSRQSDCISDNVGLFPRLSSLVIVNEYRRCCAYTVYTVYTVYILGIGPR